MTEEELAKERGFDGFISKVFTKWKNIWSKMRNYRSSSNFMSKMWSII